MGNPSSEHGTKKNDLGGTPKASYWRDEMNLAEFPLASLSTTSSADELVFADSVWDKKHGRRVTRQLTVIPSKSYGLPTPMDEEVMLALIQLSAKDEFRSQQVYFTRYELLQMLGWDRGAKSYRRVEESISRWTAVTLRYQNAWRNKAEREWVSETFHLIDRATILSRDRRCARMAGEERRPYSGKSSISWSEVVFNSFKAGNVRRLDFGFLRTLDRPVSKRLFRFLDKRFHNRRTYEADLHVFACQKIGLSKNHPVSKLKQRLLPSIRELEDRGFLEPMALERRFRRVCAGKWTVAFRKARSRTAGSRVSRQRSAPPVTSVPAIDEERAEVRKYLSALAENERHALEREAVASAPRGAQTVLRSQKAGSRVHRVMVDQLVAQHVLRKLCGAVA